MRITKALRGPTSSTARLRLSDRFFLCGHLESRDDSAPKTREDFLLQLPIGWTRLCCARKLEGQPAGPPLKNLFSWIDRGVPSTYLDSASAEQFDAAKWAGSSGRWQRTWPIRP